jgi:hypothetical protein
MDCRDSNNARAASGIKALPSNDLIYHNDLIAAANASGGGEAKEETAMTVAVVPGSHNRLTTCLSCGKPPFCRTNLCARRVKAANTRFPRPQGTATRLLEWGSSLRCWSVNSLSS